MAAREVVGVLVGDRIDERGPDGLVPDRRTPGRVPGRSARVVEMSGEYDLSTVDALHALLDAQVVGGAGDLVVDLSQVTFIDAASLRVLVGVMRRLRPDGRALVLRTPSRPARRLLEICGFQSLIETGCEDHTVLRVASGE